MQNGRPALLVPERQAPPAQERVDDSTANWPAGPHPFTSTSPGTVFWRAPIELLGHPYGGAHEIFGGRSKYSSTSLLPPSPLMISFLILSVVNPTEESQEFTLQIRRIKLRGAGELLQIAAPSVNANNEAGQEPLVAIVESAQPALPATVQIPSLSVSVYEFEIETA